MPGGSRGCPRCGLTKSLDQFEKRADDPQGVSSHCRACKNEARRQRYRANLGHEQQRSRQYYADNREAVLASRPGRYQDWKRRNPDGPWIREIKKTHGLSPERWFAIFSEQEGLCYLCEQPLPDDRSQVYIDHDHSHCPQGSSCGVCRRGMAHSNCNTAIGLMLDDPAMLRRVADNLERAKGLTAALIMSAPVQGVLLELPDVTAS